MPEEELKSVRRCEILSLFVGVFFLLIAAPAWSQRPNYYGDLRIVDFGYPRDKDALGYVRIEYLGVQMAEIPGYSTMTRLHISNIDRISADDFDVRILSTVGEVLEQFTASEFSRRQAFWTAELPGTSFKIVVTAGAQDKIKFSVDRMLLPGFRRQPESIVGKDDNKPIYELPSDSPIRTLARSVVQVLLVSVSPDDTRQQIGQWCTGFMVDQDRVMTAAHCIATSDECDSAMVAFGVAATSSTSPISPVEQIGCKRIIGVSPADPSSATGLDVTVFEIERTPAEQWGALTLRPIPLCRGGSTTGCGSAPKLALISQYKGEGKQVSMDTCHQVVPTGKDADKVTSVHFAHSCNTVRSSSGAPIIDLASGQVVGLHVEGAEQDICTTCFNLASMASAIKTKVDTWH